MASEVNNSSRLISSIFLQIFMNIMLRDMIFFSLSLSPANKLSPPSSPLAEGKDDWTVLDHDNEPTSLSPVSTMQSSLQATSPPATTNSGNKLGGKISSTFTFKMFRPGRRAQSDSGSVLSKDQGSRRNVQQPEIQTCYKCKVVRVVWIVSRYRIGFPCFKCW